MVQKTTVDFGWEIKYRISILFFIGFGMEAGCISFNFSSASSFEFTGNSISDAASVGTRWLPADRDNLDRCDLGA